MITLTEVKKFLNMDVSNTNYDEYLNNTIEATKKAIDNYCGQNIVKGQSTFHFRGMDSQFYTLKRFPVNEVVSLHYKDDPLDDWTLVADTEYIIIEGDINKLYNANGYGSSHYKLVLDTGYTFSTEIVDDAEVITSTVPEDIRLVAFEMIAVAL